MTNDPLDEAEVQMWRDGIDLDRRFRSSLRLDRLLNDSAWISALSLRRFLDEWIQRMDPVYLAVSLPAEFQFPSDDTRDRLLREVALPARKITDFRLR